MECISCNKKESDELEFSRILGDDICEECRDEHTRYCCDCDEPCWREDMVENGNGDLVCSSCFEENYSVCCCCEEIMPNDDTYFNWSDEPYCHTCYYEYYSVCDDCECEVNNEYANHNEDGGVYCDNCYSEREVDLAMLPPRPTNTISETYDNNPYKRLVGLEVENVIEDYSSGDDPPPVLWSRVSDGSLCNHGHEFVSKPANGDKLFEMIDDLSEFVWDRDGYIKPSCGFHLHVNARDLYWKELKGLLYVMYHLEPFLYRMVAKSRLGSTWCKPLPCALRDIGLILSNEDFVSMWYDWCGNSPSKEKYNDARYHGLNLHARLYLGTVEFRYHSGTNNPEKIKNWALICLSAVETGIKLSKGDKPLKRFTKNEQMTLPEIAELLGWKSDLTEYVLQRTNLLSGLDTSTHSEYIRS